ncbi:hypothetical protein GCM10009820_20820 [Leifsonia soli]
MPTAVRAASQPYDESLDAVTIDIMMPFYGDPGVFRDAVQSVLAQTDRDWRLVVIDDVYPDTAPGEWVSGLGDDRIVYLRNEVNLGVSGNFSRSVELVRSEHFVLMGCDDLLEPEYVATMRAAVGRHPDAAYFQPTVTVIDGEGRPCLPLPDRVKGWYRPKAPGEQIMRGEELAVSLLRGNWTYFPSILWRTDAVRRHGFDAAFEVVLDLNLQLEIVLDGGALVVLPDAVFRYRRHGASVSSWTASDGTRFDEERAFFLSSAAVLDERGWRRAAQVARAHWSSRFNAVTRVPSALRNARGLRSLARHAITGWSPSR